MSNITMINNKACCHFAFAFPIYDDLSMMKPHHVTTYCGCKCIKINKHGNGVFELCNLHVSKVQQKTLGSLLIPEIKINIPLTLPLKIRSYLQYIKREVLRKIQSRA